jgi:hypothetical protein
MKFRLMAQINRLASEEDLNKSYRPEVGSATKPPAKKPAQAAEIAVGSSIRVLGWQGHDCNQSSDIATVKEIEDGMYRIDVKNTEVLSDLLPNYLCLFPTSSFCDAPNFWKATQQDILLRAWVTLPSTLSLLALLI